MKTITLPFLSPRRRLLVVKAMTPQPPEWSGKPLLGENGLYYPTTPGRIHLPAWRNPFREPGAILAVREPRGVFVEVEEVFAPNRLGEMSLDEYRSLLGETRALIWKKQPYAQAQAKWRESVRVRWNAVHPPCGPKWIADEPGPWVWTARVRRVEKPDADNHD